MTALETERRDNQFLDQDGRQSSHRVRTMTLQDVLNLYLQSNGSDTQRTTGESDLKIEREICDANSRRE